MKTKMLSFLCALLIPAIFVSACGPGKVSASNLDRVTAPNVTASDMETLVEDNNAFAFELYEAVKNSNGDINYSPFSISLAFAMTYAGARGETANQMADVLHYTLPEERLHPAFNGLDLDLLKRPDELEYVDEKDRFQLSIANSLWGQDGWPFLPEYLDLLALNYGAGMHLVDFQNSPEGARRQINDWVSDQTKKRIQDILSPGVIQPATRLVLANAIYFKATWENEFDPDETMDQPFTLLDDTTVTVSMMSFSDPEWLSYTAGDGWQAVALPYKGGLTEMVVIVPDNGKFDEFEKNLTSETYADILADMQSTDVLLSMPKFTFETTYGLKDILIGMGMEDAFDPGAADFSGIDGVRDLFISDAIHKAFIAVDEKGTEAAAATVVMMMLTSMPAQDGIVLVIDRPYLFFIRDVPTGSILFMGRVLDPR